MKKLILGTAGHIDHGKTALVKALTGVDTDRLPEEKLRGITIDLGFAQLQLGAATFGVVDVPGHEGFIRNMLAGATGMDVVLLVIAADEGVMPQTHEHLAILDLLGVDRGVIAVTKCDLVTDEWAQLVIEDVRDTLKGSSLAGAPIVRVSAVTGEGLDALRAAITRQAERPVLRLVHDAFRLPIDRVFTIRGTGTVITGTVWSGIIRIDDTVSLLPTNASARVRGIEVHGEPAVSASAGERAALALTGVEKAAITRGVVAADNAPWPVTRMLTVSCRVIDGTKWSVATRQRLRVHIGTAEVLARTVVLDNGPLRAGQSGWIQLRLEEPVVARAGDRVVLRSYSPVTTIAGGVIAEPDPPKRARLAPETAAELDAILNGSAADAIVTLIRSRGARGMPAAELPLHMPHAVTAEQAEADGAAVRIGDSFFSADVVHATISTLLAAADRLHASQPLRATFDRGALRREVRGAGQLIEFALAAAIQSGELVSSGNALARKGFEPRLSPRQLALKDDLIALLRGAGLAPPTVADLGRTFGAPKEVAAILDLLEAEGQVAAVSAELYLDSSALDQALVETRTRLAAGEELAAGDFRAVLPVSRKHLIPLLEYFDRTGVTVRCGDLRKVLPTSDAG